MKLVSSEPEKYYACLKEVSTRLCGESAECVIHESGAWAVFALGRCLLALRPLKPSIDRLRYEAFSSLIDICCRSNQEVVRVVKHIYETKKALENCARVGMVLE